IAASNTSFEVILSAGIFLRTLSSFLVANGQLIYGHDGFAGELGHTTIIRDGRLCGCGKYGCLETYTSATGVARTAREILATRNDDSVLRKIPADNITSKDVFDAAMSGDAIAKEIFEYTGKLLGQAFADFVAFSAPEAIILFGGLTKAGNLILNPIRESMEANLLKIWKGKIKLLFSALSEADSAVLGASALAWEIK
ncbi:MAG TPA: ROK family protein, partial [Chitinophagaceae bacterium]|nr:ROK family protein [Chitinophagaceae bacterium]